MRFAETKVAGAYLIELEPIADERGFFARTFCRRGVRRARAQPATSPSATSRSTQRRGTLRGMHYQAAPARGGQAGALHPRARSTT